MTAAQAVQRVIDARQDLDAITYGRRALKACPAERVMLGAQVSAGQEASRRVLGDEWAASYREPEIGEFWMASAARKAREELAEAKAAQRELGTVTQLRLALAA